MRDQGGGESVAKQWDRVVEELQIIIVGSTQTLLVQLDDFYSLLFNIFLFSQYVHLHCGLKNTDSRSEPVKISSEIRAKEISLYENIVHFTRKRKCFFENFQKFTYAKNKIRGRGVGILF